jgi:hypothetical protein
VVLVAELKAQKVCNFCCRDFCLMWRHQRICGGGGFLGGGGSGSVTETGF